MEKDLMELIEVCDVAKYEKSDKTLAALETCSLLSELGFKTAATTISTRLNPILKKSKIAAGKYIEITEQKIQDFLDRKAAEYNQRPPFASRSTVIQQRNNAIRDRLNEIASSVYFQGNWISTTVPRFQFANIHSSLIAETVDYASTEPGTIGHYSWIEISVPDYKGIPPQHILRRFAEEKQKNIFDYFTIASVNSIPDPLLLGRIEHSNSRWFIAQWGADVLLDDVI